MNDSTDLKISAAILPNLVKEKVPNSVTRVPKYTDKHDGFSLVELLIVVTVAMVIAVIAVPHLQKALRAAENGNTFATMRAMASTEVSYFSQQGRFARLTELNNLMGNGLGTPSGNDVIRGRFVFSMSPAAPTDAELRNGFTITATRNMAGEGVIYVYEMTQSGEIRQILP